MVLCTKYEIKVYCLLRADASVARPSASQLFSTHPIAFTVLQTSTYSSYLISPCLVRYRIFNCRLWPCLNPFKLRSHSELAMTSTGIERTVSSRHPRSRSHQRPRFQAPANLTFQNPKHHLKYRQRLSQKAARARMPSS